MKKLLKRILGATMTLTLAMTGAPAAFAENTEAPRSYFPYPAELEQLPDNFSLPDLFEFFDASADPDGSGRVETPEEWDARSAELKDMLQYYVYGSRHDPLKGDTTVTGIYENYQYNWNENVTKGTPSPWGWSEPLKLPEGAYTMSVLDFTGFGMGMYYTGFTPVEDYVHTGDAFEMDGGLAAWKEGDTWAEHEGVVSKEKLPVLTVEMLIKDTNPENESVRSAAAAEGVKYTFSLRVPAEAPVVDGVLRQNAAGYPVLVAIGSISEEQIRVLNENGYAYIGVSNSVDPDAGQLSVYEQLYTPTDPVVHNDNTTVNAYDVDSGDLMASGWIASRALDALESYVKLSADEKAAINPDVILPDVDTYSAAITGCSNNGKRALVGGVFDNGDNGETRFKVVTMSDPGGGGTAGFRYSTEGQLFSYEPPVVNSGDSVIVHDYAYGLNESLQRAIQNTGEDQWFGDRAQIFTVRPDLADNTPFDLHALIAAFATTKETRYILCWTAEAQDAWISTPSTVLNMTAAKEVYEFLNQGDNIGIIVRDQAHANQDRDMPDIIAVMDKAYYGAETINRRFIDTLTINPDTGATNHLTAADGSGTILPAKEFSSIAAMSRSPYFIPSAYIDWSRPTKHVLWTESNSVTEGVPLTFAFHTDADKVELTLTDGETKLTGEAKDGVAEISLTAEQAKAGQYTATAIGAKDSKTIEICGWTIKDALRHSISDNSALGHDVGSGICFTTPLVNYNSETNAVRLYMNGERLPADIYDYDNKVEWEGQIVPQSGYLQPYGASLMLYADTMGYNVPMGEKVTFSIRNAKLEALQGYTIAMDIEYEKYDPNGGNGKMRMRFKPTYNTLTPQTPVWAPELLQNTPKSGLPEGEEYWPILGNWKTDFDENGVLKDTAVIRPLTSAAVESAYKVEMKVEAADNTGATISFSAPVNRNDFGVAINVVSGVSFEWADDNQSVRLVYDAPAESGEINAFVFRSVDSEGNMIGAPVQLSLAF
ncbi:MAG: hypothetical protein PHI27_02115 [Eubacteriales bacterium]|nr:hypothetical protein [Eubacteriales bacterium]MDD4511903.1 hypothetical protein [Eubacteriales bacterium]